MACVIMCALCYALCYYSPCSLCTPVMPFTSDAATPHTALPSRPQLGASFFEEKFGDQCMAWLSDPVYR